MSHSLFARKPLDLLLREMEGEQRLRRILGPLQLTALGVGAVIGTGIFVLTGTAAHDKAGPALILSLAVAGITCGFAALCYAEFAAMVPVAGSAYTYAYATLGELLAWIIGWDLILEYAVSAAAVAHGASKYFQDLIGIFGFHLPRALTDAPVDYDPSLGRLVGTGSVLDLTALILVTLVTLILIVGIRQSASLNASMVVLKVGIVLFVIAVGAFYVVPANWRPFAPYGMTGINFFGLTVAGLSDAGGQPLGMLAGAGIIFFSYIGFDSVSTHAEEARNPRRDVPFAILASLVICTVLYMAVGAVLTGMVPYDHIDVDAPISQAFRQVGLTWAQFVISLGAIAGITSVVLVTMLSQARILLAMARDGLLPAGFFGAIHPRFRTPWKSTLMTGGFVVALSAILPLRVLSGLINIGTLLAFVIVCAAVWIMRHTHPDAERPFKAPLVPLVPLLGIVTCLLLMFSLPAENWVRLFVWLLLGLGLYFGYGRRHSVLSRSVGCGDARREASRIEDRPA
ncbi:MAG TPA: amino acid permease [Candidatus Polarisedimenticolia bacterium]|nr:amino acid permease [Candidatus Polarisedimenticolia bacterium]